MTLRGRVVVELGVVVYVAAWAFGSKPLYPVATGLLVVSVLAWLWVRLAKQPPRSVRRDGLGEHLEGDDVSVVVELEPGGSVAPPVATLVERVGRLGERRVELRRIGRRLRAQYTLHDLPRGRYVFGDARVELSDPFGLQCAVVPLPEPGALLVFPRLVQVERLFSESAAHALAGRRLLLRRPTGFDLHSVRDYVEGESLRAIHWRSTARRGRLMVKELEDAPRDEIGVVLDADVRTSAGPAFETQVRAAGSILDAHVRRGRRAVLVVNAGAEETRRVRSVTGDPRRALELLATVEPVSRTPLATLLADESGAAARAQELVVVTGVVDSALVDHLVQRAAAHRKTSLVFVDSPTFAGRPASRPPELLRLQAAGVAVAVVRAGDDLRASLEGSRPAEAAHV